MGCAHDPYKLCTLSLQAGAGFRPLLMRSCHSRVPNQIKKQTGTSLVVDWSTAGWSTAFIGLAMPFLTSGLATNWEPGLPPHLFFIINRGPWQQSL